MGKSHWSSCPKGARCRLCAVQIQVPRVAGSEDGPVTTGRGGGASQRGGHGSMLLTGKGADVTDKSPRKTASKKSGKTLKEKREAKKDKERTRKGLGR